jgi:signal transduction histidine kinase
MSSHNHPLHAFREALFLALLLACVSPLCAEPASAPLTRIGDVTALAQAPLLRGHPVQVTGIVTVSEPDWDGRFFLQDSSGGIFVENFGPRPVLGSVVRVDGVSAPGSFAPIITLAHCEELGMAPLPEPRQPPIRDVIAGLYDSLRIQVQGMVRSVRLQGNRFVVDLLVGGVRLPVVTPAPQGIDPQAMVGRLAQVRGTAAATSHERLRHLTHVNLFVPSASDFIIQPGTPSDPFDFAVIPLGEVGGFRRSESGDGRVHVRGVVSHVREGGELFLQDASGSMLVREPRAQAFHAGEVVDVVGFVDTENYLPVINDALVRQRREAPREPVVKQVDEAELLDGLHPYALVSLRGRVLSGVLIRARRPDGSPGRTMLSWTLANDRITFVAEMEVPRDTQDASLLPVGALVRIDGLVDSDSTENGRPVHLRLLIPSREHTAVLESAPWLTAGRLVQALGVGSLVALAFSFWTITLSRKNARLLVAAEERERARRELAEAYEKLDERVRERTRQLRSEMSSRKSAELQFKAILGERTRLAQELHDTLVQTLVGISFQLDTAAKLFDRGSAEARGYLETARELIRQSETELRHSIWDLRSRALDLFDLSRALTEHGTRIVGAAGLAFSVNSEGQPRPLPEVVEENLLRVAQEALANVVRHSRATSVELRLLYREREVVVEICDNGRGLDTLTESITDKRHFGLVGMQERMKRIGGRLEIEAAPGQGLLVRASVSLPPAGEVPDLAQVKELAI